MKLFKTFFLLLLIANPVFSQTIINAERLTSGEDSTIYSLAFSYNGTRGNLVTDRLAISPSFILTKEQNEFKVLGGYSFLSQSNTTILHSGFVHLRHNYKITNRLKSFEFYQYQFNEVLLLNRREVLGGGLRYQFIDKDSLNFDIGLGAIRETEILNRTTLLSNELSETTYYRASCVSSFSWKLGKNVKIYNVIYFQPYLKNFSDYRLLNDFNMIFSITKQFELIAALTTRYDNMPPGSLESFDNALDFGFNLKF